VGLVRRDECLHFFFLGARSLLTPQMAKGGVAGTIGALVLHALHALRDRRRLGCCVRVVWDVLLALLCFALLALLYLLLLLLLLPPLRGSPFRHRCSIGYHSNNTVSLSSSSPPPTKRAQPHPVMPASWPCPALSSSNSWAHASFLPCRARPPTSLQPSLTALPHST
jgi:hypothetical protein